MADAAPYDAAWAVGTDNVLGGDAASRFGERGGAPRLGSTADQLSGSGCNITAELCSEPQCFFIGGVGGDLAVWLQLRLLTQCWVVLTAMLVC